MLTKAQIKLITSLRQKKIRQQKGVFVVEGVKSIKEFLKSTMQLHQLYTSTSIFDVPQSKQTLISDSELKKISALKTPNTALAIFNIPNQKPISSADLVIALDGVSDPGNLGTIIRLCDWFGVSSLICSLNTVDCYNPKVVQATMGSLTRVEVHYVDLFSFLTDYKASIYGGFMKGNSVYSQSIKPQGVLVLGNEANGISKAIAALINNKISIPNFSKNQSTESLNVATATAILLSEFKRRTTEK